jgi:hypothetical protein
VVPECCCQVCLASAGSPAPLHDGETGDVSNGHIIFHDRWPGRFPDCIDWLNRLILLSDSCFGWRAAGVRLRSISLDCRACGNIKKDIRHHVFEEFMAASIQSKYFSFAIAGVLLSAAVVTTQANAQDATRDAQERACSRDVSRHCRKQINDGDFAIHQCLQQNRDKLSPSCRKVIEGR